MVPPIHLGAWSMALMLWLPFELLLLLYILSVNYLCTVKYWIIYVDRNWTYISDQLVVVIKIMSSSLLSMLTPTHTISR